MKLRILLLNLIVLIALNLSAQTKGKKQTHSYIEGIKHVHDENGCTLYANERMSNVFIPFGVQKQHSSAKNGNAPNAVFEVDYFGFTAEAQSALQFSFDALSNLITSTVPIRVSASWEVVGGGTLGFSRPGEVVGEGDNARSRNSFYGIYGSVYPAALADKLAGFNIGGDFYDISLTINSTADWHFDPTDNSNIGNKYDLATVMMHEIIHGLGFNGASRVDNNGLGFIEFSNDEIGIYDEFLEDNNGVPLRDLGSDGSAELGSALTSGQLFFVMPSLDNLTQQIHAPLTYSGGSSIYHLHESATDSADVMMTPFASRGEIRSDPGVATTMMHEMGWQFSTIIYEPEIDYSEDLTQNFTIEAEVSSDLGFDTASIRLIYSQDTFNMDRNTVTMVFNPSTNKFEASIPAPNAEAVYQYKLEAEHNNDRVGTISAPPFTSFTFYDFAFIKDVIPPVIDHTELANINSTDVSFQIKATVLDSFAMNGVVRNASVELDTVYIEYNVNSGNNNTAGANLTSDGFGEFFLANGSLSSGLTSSDVVNYRIIAIDASEAANMSVYPTDGSFITVPIIDVFDPVTDYINDFEDLQNDDFTFDRFQIGFVNGFDSPVLMNRDHPYRTAGNGNTVNFSATLKAPIIIAADSASAFIKFKEIVLVEPGEPGTSFGDTEFWDYVIIEAKKLSGGDWEPLVDGYDSDQQATWRATYNNNVNQVGTSSGAPNVNMYRAKEFSLLGSNSPFVAGDTVLVRFRLFSDPGANGWGWMIENLNIQNPDVNVAVEDFIETNDFIVYPNPNSTGILNISAQFTKSSKNLRTELMDMYGRLIRTQQIADGTQQYTEEIDISDLPAGIYLMTLRDNESAITQKVVKY